MSQMNVATMTEGDRKADYEKSARDPWRWQRAAENLFDAAAHLYSVHDAAMAKVQQMKAGNVPAGFDMDIQAHYLQGKCIELYLKCWLVIARAQVTENGKLTREFQSHELISLCQMAGFNASVSEKATLRKLTDAVTFWGTYPIPTRFTKWRPNVKGMGGIPPVWFWTPADTDNYLRVVNRLREHVGAQSQAT